MSDIAISAEGTAAGVQIVNNTVNVSGGDYALQLAPALFQAGSQVSGNSFPTGLAAGVALTGQVDGHGDGGAADAGSEHGGEHVRGAESVGAGGGDADDRGGGHADGGNGSGQRVGEWAR